MAPIQFPKTGKADVPPSTGGKSTEDLKAEVKARIEQIHATETEQSAYLSADDIAELEKMETLLQGSLALLDQFEKTGALSMPDAGEINGSVPNSAALKEGWNGSFDTKEDTNGVYDAILYPHNTGKDVKNALIYKAKDGDEVIGKNVEGGVEVIADGKKYLIVGMDKNPIPLVIAADQTTKGVTVNFSAAKLAGDLTILGGSGDDTLIGSQGNDKIYGNAGKDYLYGMGGVNTLEGGADTDTITGGSGKNAISGGAGYDTVYRAKGDTVTDMEGGSEIETQAFDKSNFNASKSTGWEAAETADGSELEIRKKDGFKEGGTITLTVPEGYMAFGRAENEDLVVVFQQMGDDGIPIGQQEIVRLKGFLKPNNKTVMTLHSEGANNMIDLAGINVGFNVIKLADGDKAIFMKPTTAIDEHKINQSELGKSNLSKPATKKIRDEMLEDEDFKKSLKEDASYDKGSITLTPKSDVSKLDIPAPDGFTKGIIQEDKDSYTLTLYITDEKSKESKRLVVYVKKSGDAPETITVGGETLISV